MDTAARLSRNIRNCGRYFFFFFFFLNALVTWHDHVFCDVYVARPLPQCTRGVMALVDRLYKKVYTAVLFVRHGDWSYVGGSEGVDGSNGINPFLGLVRLVDEFRGGIPPINGLENFSSSPISNDICSRERCGRLRHS